MQTLVIGLGSMGFGAAVSCFRRYAVSSLVCGSRLPRNHQHHWIGYRIEH